MRRAYLFADRYFGYDDGLYAAVRMLAIAAQSETTVAEMRASLPQVLNTPEIRIECSEQRKFAIIKEVQERLKAEGADYNDVDGVRVNTPNGWWLLRASNTQSVLVARCEATSEEHLQTLQKMVRDQLAHSDLVWEG